MNDIENQEYIGPVDPEMCKYTGHEWANAGGGLEICLRCEEECWADERVELP